MSLPEKRVRDSIHSHQEHFGRGKYSRQGDVRDSDTCSLQNRGTTEFAHLIPDIDEGTPSCKYTQRHCDNG